MVRQGHIIWVDFDPQVGHEQAGRRPAVVVSGDGFNDCSGLAIVCPITNASKIVLNRVELDYRTKTTGVVLCSHVKSLDIRSRTYKFIEVIPRDLLVAVIGIIKGFFGELGVITDTNMKGH